MLPLRDLRVLDLGQYITGPYATVCLAEMGADVVKVEPPTGDPFRSWEGGPVKATFMAFNRGKRSVVLDLKTEQGTRRLLDLVSWADVLVENFRPGVMQRLGVGPEVCAQRNPALIYCSITGFGSSGPYAGMPAFDGVALAYSGLAGLLLDPDDPRLRGPALADTITGYAAALGVLSAVIERYRTSEGRYLEVSMLGALAHFLQPALFRQVVEGIEEGPYTRPHNSQAYVFVCSDGEGVMVHLSAPRKFWEGLCEAVGRRDLLSDPRFDGRFARRDNYEVLRGELQPIFAARTSAEWLEVLQRLGVPSAPVNRIGDVLEDAGLRHLGILDVVDLPGGGRAPRLRPPTLFDGAPLQAVSHAPQLGEHTETVLAEIQR